MIQDIFKALDEVLPEFISRDGYPRNQAFWDDVLNIFKKEGCEYLGSGYFSAAFTHPTDEDKVIKIGFKKEDSGAAYAAFCRVNAGMHGLPVIHELNRREKFYYVILDKYITMHKASDIFDRLHEKHKINEVVFTRALHDRIQNHIQYGSKIKETSPYYETCEKILEFFQGLAEFDLHDENVMVCPKTWNIIITDPVSFSSGNSRERLEEKLASI